MSTDPSLFGSLAYGRLADGAVMLAVDPSGAWVRYSDSQSGERLRFRAEDAFTEGSPRKHPPTEETRAGSTTDGKVEVLEGRNRAVDTALGDRVLPESGGVPDAEGWLDYRYVPLGDQASGSTDLRPIRGMVRATTGSTGAGP